MYPPESGENNENGAIDHDAGNPNNGADDTPFLGFVGLSLGFLRFSGDEKAIYFRGADNGVNTGRQATEDCCKNSPYQIVVDWFLGCLFVHRKIGLLGVSW